MIKNLHNAPALIEASVAKNPAADHGGRILDSDDHRPDRTPTTSDGISDYGIPIPEYLRRVYSYFYIKPWAIRLFERPWLVNLILWGWYRNLGNAALEALGVKLRGATIQIGCAYGNLTQRLASQLSAAGGRLDVVDIVEGQLRNMKAKLDPKAPVRGLCMNSADLKIPDATYDRGLLFMLLHEMPQDVRAATLNEALRVIKPGGKLVIVDFAPCSRWHPLKYLWQVPLSVLEPFAPDIWTQPIEHWLPESHRDKIVARTFYFGRFYQRIVIEV
ncbi:rhodoquinone biosynthesis methyltransferase RquA [Paraburkholderia sp.]|uniref:rhodoquinone biosynthesis methyltransferase RquA n=1 Tax=Paraburkholderia sp. TaxID=1926495 RepID=UPI0025DEF6B6|nr:rhodoquinone biosynthesis methyltransferase RquA [Paraburkholderia sp.]